MIPTHRHADGGYYRLYATGISGKDEVTGEWLDGVLYQCIVDGKVRWTSASRWADRFVSVNPNLVTERIEELKDDQDDIVGSFQFTVEEVDDIRFMLIKAGPQTNHKMSAEQLSYVRRVLGAMAESITEGLHIRDHDFPDLIGDVSAFHAKFGQEYTGKVRQLPEDLHRFRVGFHEEETHEYRDEYPKLTQAIERGDRRDILTCLENQLDALVDAAWVILGTADLQFGRAAFNEAWRRVVKANMAKVRKDQTTDGDGSLDSGREPTYDIVKPAGWVAPEHRDLVADNAIFDELFGQVETNTFNQDA
jgi:predicted HAD superfamily Cof-like phosphohydrolase